MKKTFIWLGALVLGALLGLSDLAWLNEAMEFTADVFTRLFQLLSAPTIVLAVVTTLAGMGRGSGAGRLFRRTLGYTLLTTVAAAAVGAALYLAVSPTPPEVEAQAGNALLDASGAEGSYAEHILNVIPNNIVRPLLEGNVLSLLLLAFAVGVGLSHMPESENRTVVLRGLYGLQELLFLLIRGLIWALPLGIVAFSARLSAQMAAGVVAGALGRYVLVVLVGNAIQFFVVLPLLLLSHGLNPLKVLSAMSPAVLTALFTKSSAATLPVTVESAQDRLGVRSEVARFVLPICCTINMNGCAAFILVTSLFVMQSGGMPITMGTILLWLLISVVSAVGNAGVPMGCFFLTFSLMSGIGAPVDVLGLILPVYTVIDMVETAENVWSDSCVCAVVDSETRQIP